MGYAVLHIDKAKGNDLGVTAHIERTYTLNNVDASRTQLNRALVQFPENITSRTQAIEHRIATASIYRKVSDNQVRALRFIFSGSHEDMLRIEKEGRLGEWCEASMDWLRQTFGAENVVAATLHADEETPHIHATVVPIVQGERRKAKDEANNGKRKYKLVRTQMAAIYQAQLLAKIVVQQGCSSKISQFSGRNTLDTFSFTPRRKGKRNAHFPSQCIPSASGIASVLLFMQNKVHLSTSLISKSLPTTTHRQIKRLIFSQLLQFLFSLVGGNQ